jgi:hypothetical protein
MVDRLSAYARSSGLGVALLGTDVVYAEWLSAPVNREDIPLPHSATDGRPARLVDWSRSLVVQMADSLSVRDLKGSTLGEIEQPANVDGCVFNREAMALLFWGRRRQGTDYGVYLGDLRSGTTKTISEWAAGSAPDGQSVTASFVDHDATVIRIASGLRSYEVRTSGAQVGSDPWHIQWAEGSSDGRLVAGRGANGNLVIIDLVPSKTWDTGIPIIGEIRWDPSSRYVLGVKPTPGLPWSAQTEIVVLDVEMRASAEFPALAPDERYHTYEWILRT